MINGLKVQEVGPKEVDTEFYDHLEKVVLAKLKEFTLHDLIKVFSGFYKLGQGSGNFYE